MLSPVAAADAVPNLTGGVALEVVASGLSLAVDLTAPPGDDRLFVVEKAGRIRIIENGVLLARPFLDITGPVLSAANEQGLLGLAFPPDYASSGLFYVYYTSDAGNGDTAVAEYSVGANRNIADAASGRILLAADQPFTNHNGGAIKIGPDGYLYVALGDGGSGGDPRGNGQNKSTLLGSILRLDPATGAPAPGNPFIGETGADEIWAWGLRNPWRFSFDAATGDMFIGDVGQREVEEIDVLPAGLGGANFGWNTYEGSSCFNGPCSGAGLTFPVHEYSHRSGGACGGSVTGGYVYRGNELPWLRGHYFYADWCHSDDLRSFRMRRGRAVDHIDWGATLAVPGFITSFGTDGFGELHFLAQGKVYRLVSERTPECDFDGDGVADIAVGVPGESHSAAASAGLVQEFRGSSDPFDPANDRTWRQSRRGLGGTPEAGDLFGSALACGDFNADGFWDLAIGVPGEGAGTVQTLYGSAAGLSADQSNRWTQATLGVGEAAAGERFGAALASGDFNRDGYADLAIGAPDDAEAGPAASGSVTAVFGGPGGLSPAGAVLLHQDSPSIRGVAAAGDQLGYSIASGDIDGDGYFDIVAGAPGDTVSGKAGAGSVAVVFGKPLGIGPRDLRVTRDTRGIKGRSGAGARWGIAVATGAFDGDGFDDIAVGVEGRRRVGAVQLIYGNSSGLSRRDGIYREGSSGTPGVGERGDRFGAVLAAGDADGDGYDELAVGVPGESHSGKTRAGMAVVFAGSRTGVVHADPQRFHQNTTGIKGAAGDDDEFAAALRFLDTRGDGRLDLVVGAPGDNIGGQVALIPGRVGGLSAAGDVLWSQDTLGVGGVAEAGDRFGGAL
jgi:glucose/arabinose dehydrogenase